MALAFTAICIDMNGECFVVEIVPPQLLVERLLAEGLVSYEMVPRVACLQPILKISEPLSIVRWTNNQSRLWHKVGQSPNGLATLIDFCQSLGPHWDLGRQQHVWSLEEFIAYGIILRS